MKSTPNVVVPPMTNKPQAADELQATNRPHVISRSHLPATFAALRHRNFRLWFFGQTLSMMGTWMQSVAQGWLVFQLTGSEFALGAVSFVGTAPALFLMLPAGALIDRTPRRQLLLMTQTAMMLLAFILAGLAASGILQVWHVALLAVGLGVANSFDAPARQALAVEMVEDRRDLMNAIALNSTIFNLARVVGPAVGGAALALLGAAWCFALNGISFLAVIAALLMMRLPASVNAPSREPLTAQIRAGLRYAYEHRATRAIILLVGVASLFGMSYAVLLPAFAVDVLNVGEAGLGALNAAAGVGALIGSLVVASMASFRHKGWVLTVGSLAFPLGLLALSFSRSFVLSLAFLVAVGLAIVTQNATCNTLVQSSVPDELRGRVMAVYTLMFFGTAPFGALQAGAIAQASGTTAGVAVGAGVVLLFAVGIFFAAPGLRRAEG
jgi:MFS family permease